MKAVHPLAEFIPERAHESALVMEIAQNGVREPVILYEGQILEGRVRARAAQQSDTEPQFRDWVLFASGDPLEWAIRHHIETYEPTELERINLIAQVLPYFRQLPGKTEERLNRATGVSIRKIRVLDWLHDTSALEPVLGGEKDILQAGREAGLVSEKRGLALGTNFGAGDKFDDAIQPIKRYLAAWKRKGYEFRHVNPKEASRRVSLIDSLIEELQAAKLDLQKRAVTATLSAPPERKRK